MASWSKCLRVLYKLLGKPKADWMYMTEPDPSLNGRKVMWSAGKMLGGGSSINGMMYIRGSRADYDSWEQDLGCTGWGWNNVQTYFKRSEGFDGAPSHRIRPMGRLALPCRARFIRCPMPLSMPAPISGCARLMIIARVISTARSLPMSRSGTASGQARRAPSSNLRCSAPT